ncbi:MAG: hypothetical protein Q7T68_15890 [Sphingopyxis sp.]|nr:hypothetical protein [Sphingopyxis sp.]
MLQRAELHRRLDVARAALRPSALVKRGKYRLDEKIDDTAHTVREQFRSNRLPIAVAAVAGLAWLFREPIKENVPAIGRKIRDFAANVADHFRPADTQSADQDEIEPIEDDDHEALR